MILSGWSRLSYLTCLDGLLTASKVAQEFEFTPLRQTVFEGPDSPERMRDGDRQFL